jgi:hypothetical protein
VSRALVFESLFLVHEAFEVDVLEILRQLAFYMTIDRPEINNTARINKIEQQTEDYQHYDAMTR